MPAEIFGEKYQFLPKAKLLTFEEITRLAQLLIGLGAVKIRLTGGEPLVRNNVEQLVSMLSKLPGLKDLTMTTNGYLLPQKAQLLKDAGLDRISISLDSLDEETFKVMNGRGFSTNKVIDGISAAEEAGFSPLKINSVVQRDVNDSSILGMARYFKERGHTVRFIEYMDVGNLNGWNLDQVVPAEEIVSKIDAEMPLEPINNNYRGEVASRYKYKDGSGEIGIISSVTNPFCGDCTRLRLSPEGRIVTCLFASLGTDLLSPIRAGASDNELTNIVTDVWRGRSDRYSEQRSSMTERTEKVEMYHIGG
tara:strand:- start:912 stop:1832 length:921 start_codon:yes stop_codon:yes gene_type:complete